ncbi:MAG: HPr family phosphocarrier protein [Ruminococcus flavefaciens]|nr:HPr family phosphocarrier protein [Ruminococcus flavefaciens]
MSRMKIRLTTPEEVANFINICSKYECDINLYDGRNVIDAKSIVAVFTVSQGKEVEVEAISDDDCVIRDFVKNMRKFEV